MQYLILVIVVLAALLAFLLPNGCGFGSGGGEGGNSTDVTPPITSNTPKDVPYAEMKESAGFRIEIKRDEYVAGGNREKFEALRDYLEGAKKQDATVTIVCVDALVNEYDALIDLCIELKVRFVEEAC